MVKENFAQLGTSGDQAAAYFYGRLFAENPRLRAMFPPAMDVQRDRLFHALTKIVWSLDSPGTLAGYLSQLGRDHRKFGVLREHYPAVGAALIATLRKFSDEWTPEVEASWRAAYQEAAETMLAAASEDASQAPPWWVAEVHDHDRRSHDLAVLTVRPGQPFSFTAGQYLTVQTARWPRVWRPYSIANAPRSDGMVRLHVRALPGGWVSGALVRHTKIGDGILLGPALGTMTLDPESGRDLLLIAGGTGLAPLKALAEQVIMSERHRNIRLLVGARTERDLYDMADLHLLQSTYPWLRVIPVLSDEPDFDGMKGQIPDVLGRFHDCEDDDVYVSGPTGMVRDSVGELQRLGVPPARIRHDLLGAEEALREAGTGS
ncbi:globin domain-containing protein [Spirillospora sp. NPDC048911]|uniref:globin domain-containing protein n=1 Tax=Spirillospora sp. NPDC048911 TaxID=3364527 RepID=UPI0037220E5F